MVAFYPLVIRRSDGKKHIKLKNGSLEPNKPLPAQLDQKPSAKGVCDFYRECAEGDAKEVDWRRKLAGMLIREVAPAEAKEKNFILAALPQGYHLYEHVKYTVDPESKEQKQVKTHAAGGNERQDAYLYGHPQGRKKRFRSPAEFFPHLLWLSTDETGNTDNCSCKLCCPEEIGAAKKEEPTNIIAPRVKPEPGTTPGLVESKSGARPDQTAVAPSRAALAPVQPNALPRFRSAEQKQDSSSQRPLYRPGEVVWFFKGSAWGLGIIVKRDTARQAYTIQPLSHPFDSPAQATRGPQELRPWLAWSPPPLTCAALNPSPQNGNREVSFEAVDWNAVCSKRMGPCDAEVDGSILAVKGAEDTLTPFQLLSDSPSERHYNGIFLGAEKVWVGDAMRTRNNQQSELFVLHDILEQPNKTDTARPRILLVGDVYSWAILDPRLHSNPPDAMTLPARVREDLNLRNAFSASSSDSSKRFKFYWKPERKAAHLTVADVKGRWYASGELMPILAPQKYAQAKAAAADIGDVGMMMNGQGDCNKREVPGRPGMVMYTPATIKKETREEAFGRAVPAALHISKGLDEQAGSPATENRPASSGFGQRPMLPQQQPQQQPFSQPNFGQQNGYDNVNFDTQMMDDNKEYMDMGSGFNFQ